MFTSGDNEMEMLPTAFRGNSRHQSSKNIKVYSSFEEMELKDNLMKGIHKYGFVRPSAIQRRGIMPIVEGKDLIAQSQSGTGKTGMFIIGMLQSIDTTLSKTQAMILLPTRELALQTEQVLEALGHFMGLQSLTCIGGRLRGRDLQNLRTMQHVICGTPGRVLDLIDGRAIDTSYIKLLILDEADEMLNTGFEDQLYKIFRSLRRGTQLVLSSATMPAEVLELAGSFTKDPTRILISRDEITLEEIKQFFVRVQDDSWKFDTLVDLYETLTISQGVIFCNTKSKVKMLAEALMRKNFPVFCFHGDMTQEERDETMRKFTRGESRILICTDVWSRGIDIPQVSLVVNYDLPNQRETYIHRIGRSGRFGRKGVAINFVLPAEVTIMRDIEQYFSTQIDELPERCFSIMQ